MKSPQDRERVRGITEEADMNRKTKSTGLIYKEREREREREK